eukprot:Opistho-2@29561
MSYIYFATDSPSVQRSANNTASDNSNVHVTVNTGGWIRPATMSTQVEAYDSVKESGDKTPACLCPSFIPGLLSVVFPFVSIFCCYTVTQGEEVVVLHYGKYSGTNREPGCACTPVFGREMRHVSVQKRTINLRDVRVLDIHGNPIVVSSVVMYSVINSKKAALDVSNYEMFVADQAAVALKQVVALFPYEATETGEACLKKEPAQVYARLRDVLQEKVIQAGITVHSVQLDALNYAPEIAGAMLKRQQAKALIDARALIVKSAVGIAVDAVQQLEARGIGLTEQEKGRLVTNILTITTGETAAVPTIPI